VNQDSDANIFTDMAEL